MSTYQDQNFYNAGRTVYAGGSGAKRIRLYNEDGSKTGARIDGRVRKVHKMGQPHKSFAQENAERAQRQRERKIERAKESGTFDRQREAYNKDNGATYMDEDGKIHDQRQMNVDRAKQDGSFDTKRDAYNKGNRDTFMDQNGKIGERDSSNREGLGPAKQWAQVPDGQGGYKHVEIPRKEEPENKGARGDGRDLPNNVIQGDPRADYHDMFKRGISDDRDFQGSTMEMRYGPDGRPQPPRGVRDDKGREQPQQPAAPPKKEWAQVPDGQGGYKHVEIPPKKGPAGAPDLADELTPEKIEQTKEDQRGNTELSELRGRGPKGPPTPQEQLQQPPMKDWEARKEARDLKKAAKNDPDLARELKEQAKQQKVKPHVQRKLDREQRKLDREQRKVERAQERTDRDARKAERQGMTREQRQADRTRERNIEKAKKDGTFDGKRDAFNKGSKTHQMDEKGKITPRAPAQPPAQDPAKQPGQPPAGQDAAKPPGTPATPAGQPPAQKPEAPAAPTGQTPAQKPGAPAAPTGQTPAQKPGAPAASTGQTPGGSTPTAPKDGSGTAPASAEKPAAAPAPVQPERTPSRYMGENNQWQSRDEYFKKAEARQGQSNQYSDVAKQGEEGREAPPPAPSNAMFKTDSGKWQTRDEFFGEAAQRQKRSNQFGDYHPEKDVKPPVAGPKPTPPVETKPGTPPGQTPPPAPGAKPGQTTPTTPGTPPTTPGAKPGTTPGQAAPTVPGATPKPPALGGGTTPNNSTPAAPKANGIASPVTPPAQPNPAAATMEKPMDPLNPNGGKPGMPGGAPAVPGNAMGGGNGAPGAGMGAGQQKTGVATAMADDDGGGEATPVDAGGGTGGVDGGGIAPDDEKEPVEN